MNDSVKSFFIFFRLFWYISIVFLLLFILFDCKRLYDFVTNDYQLEKMFVETCKWGGHSQTKKDLTIFGNINTNEKVCIYLYRDNISGELMLSQKAVSNTEHWVDFQTQLAAGTYILVLETPYQQLSKKIIIY